MPSNAAQRRGRRGLLPLAVILMSLCGCSPNAFLSAEEDRDRNFQRARDAARMGDHVGAAEFYERALDYNPRSADVHLGFASLCEGPLERYADAVYHYQKYLRLRPEDPRADDIRRRITNCMERLAARVPMVIRNDVIARELEIMRQRNAALQQEVERARAEAARWSNDVRRLVQMAEQRSRDREPGARFASDPVTSPVRVAGADRAAGDPREGGGSSAGRPRSEAPTAVTTRFQDGVRLHRIRRGDTLSRISREYNVSVEALRRANPDVDERRLIPGRTVRVPR